jgi:hypothetical protein
MAGLLEFCQRTKKIVMSLVSTDYRNYEKEMTEIKKARNRYQVLLDLVTDVLNVSDLNQLRYIALKGRDGLFDKLEQQIEQPEISGMPISRRAAVTMLELPDLDQLDQAAERAKQHKEQPYATKIPFLPQARMRLTF